MGRPMGAGAFLATTIGKAVAAVLGLAIVGGVTLGGLYLGDYGFEATIVDKSCRLGGASTISVQPKVFPTTIEQNVPHDQCSVIQRGNFVVYNVRSERVRVYAEEGGALLWDSANKAGAGAGGLFINYLTGS